MQVELVRKQREVDLEKLEIVRRENQYDSDVKKKADADRYAVEQAAEGDKLRQMRRAEGRQFEIEAEAKANAEAQRSAGAALGDATRSEGLAQAEVTRQKGFAEAEAKEKLAEAFEKFGEAAVLDLLAKMMPQLAREIATPLGSIDRLTVVDTGNGAGAARLTNTVTELMATTPDLVKMLTGVDLGAVAQRLSGGDRVTGAHAIEARAAEARTQSASVPQLPAGDGAPQAPALGAEADDAERASVTRRGTAPWYRAVVPRARARWTPRRRALWRIERSAQRGEPRQR